MSRAKIKAIINQLKEQMRERKPYETVPYEMEETEDFPVSMRPVTSGSMGNNAANSASQTIDRVMSSLPESCKGARARKIISEEAASL